MFKTHRMLIPVIDILEIVSISIDHEIVFGLLLTSHIYPYSVDGMAWVVFFEMWRFKALGAIKAALIRGKMWMRVAYLRNSFGPMMVQNSVGCFGNGLDVHLNSSLIVVHSRQGGQNNIEWTPPRLHLGYLPHAGRCVHVSILLGLFGRSGAFGNMRAQISSSGSLLCQC